MDKAGFAGSVIEGAIMGTGVGMAAKGSVLVVKGAEKIISTFSTNSVRAAMGTGAVAGGVNGLTQAAVKTFQDTASKSYQ